MEVNLPGDESAIEIDVLLPHSALVPPEHTDVHCNSQKQRVLRLILVDVQRY